MPATTTDAGGAASTEGVSARAVGGGNVDPGVLWIVGAVLVAAGLAGGFGIAVARSRRRGTVVG